MSIFEANLRALTKVDPALAGVLTQVPSFTTTAHLAEDGAISFRTGGDQGKWVQSRRAPKLEAERLFGQVKLRRLETLVLVGFGGGYCAQHALAEDSSRSVLVIEPNLSIIRTVLETLNLSEEIVGRRLVFFNQLPNRSAQEAMSPIAYGMAAYGNTLLAHPYTKSASDYDAHLALFSQVVAKLGVSLQTEFGGASIYTANELANLCHYLQAPPVHGLKGIFEGRTAVLCGAGPSLTKQLLHLLECQDRVFVFAVSSALKRVQAAGIRVDSTAMVDYSHLSERYFRDLESYPPLWAQPNAHPMVLDSYEGPKLLADKPSLSLLLGDEFPPRGVEMLDSTNVSHFGYHALRFLGFSKIVLIGMDQAYTNHVSHSPGAPMYDEMAASASRFSSLEAQELIAITLETKMVSAGKDLNGVELVTDPQMAESANTFEAFFQRHPEVQVINSTGAGRRLKGAVDMPLEEALADSTQPIDIAEFHAEIERASQGLRKDLARGKAKLNAKQRWARSVDSALGALEKAYQVAAQKLAKGENASTSKETKKLESVIGEHGDLYQWISKFSAADNFARMRAKRDVEELDLSRQELQARLADIEYSYLSGLRAGFQRWNGTVEFAALRMNQAIEGKTLGQQMGGQEALATSKDSPRVLDAYIELSDDPIRRAAFLGDQYYSPIRQAIAALKTQPAIRRIVINAKEGTLPEGLADERVVFVDGSQAADLPRREAAIKMMRWSSVSTLRGLGMVTSLATNANPHRILEDLGNDAPDFLMVVPDDCGVLTEEIVAHLIDAARETHWEQAMYLGEGPQGLFPYLWEMDSLRQVARDQTATQVVFLQTGSFWGRSFVHVPIEIISMRRSFSLSSQRGREMTKAVAKQLDGSAPNLELLREYGLKDWQSWVGDSPLDVELEFTTQRPHQPNYLPKLTREAVISAELVQKIAKELASFEQGVNLTIGGQGDPLLHPQAMELIELLRPAVQALNVRTLFATEEQLLQLREIGVDAITVRVGAWGKEEYQEVNGCDRFEPLAQTMMNFAQDQLSRGQQLPMLVPEVVKSLAADKHMVQFKQAWWSIATFPHVIGFNTFGGALEDKTTLKLYPGKRSPCMRAQEQMVIFADGSVPLCWQDFDAKEPIGNLTQASIRELWRSPKLESLRESHAQGKWARENPACEGCNQWYRFS